MVLVPLEKYFEFMQMKSDKGKIVVKSIDEIRFENVFFSYGTDRNILQNVSFTLKKNNGKIAIVGKNGSGKSSIIKLLMGFYENYEGKISINGRNLCELSKGDYRKRISVLYQDFRLFSMTVDQNVSMEYESSEEKVNEFLKKVKVYEKIKSLPDQNRTILSKEFDKDGIYLSGGEQQKIGLARSLFRNSDVLILDEPFSNMDCISIDSILKEIENVYLDKIIILITHDLHNLYGIDRILLLDNGQIVEDGTEKELLSKRGQYYQMWKRANTKEEETNERL